MSLWSHCNIEPFAIRLVFRIYLGTENTKVVRKNLLQRFLTIFFIAKTIGKYFARGDFLEGRSLINRKFRKQVVSQAKKNWFVLLLISSIIHKENTKEITVKPSQAYPPRCH